MSVSVLETNVAKRVSATESMITKILYALSNVEHNFAEVRVEIDGAFQLQEVELQQRKKSLLGKLDELYQGKLETLHYQLDFLRDVLHIGKCCLDSIKAAKEDGQLSEQLRSDAENIYKGFYPLELEPVGAGNVLFEYNDKALRKAIAEFGNLKSLDRCKSVSTLPCPLEEYEDFEHFVCPFSERFLSPAALASSNGAICGEVSNAGAKSPASNCVFRWLTRLGKGASDVDTVNSTGKPSVSIKSVESISFSSADSSDGDLLATREWLDTFSIEDSNDQPSTAAVCPIAARIWPSAARYLQSVPGDNSKSQRDDDKSGSTTAANNARAIAAQCQKILKSDPSIWRVRQFKNFERQ